MSSVRLSRSYALQRSIVYNTNVQYTAWVCCVVPDTAIWFLGGHRRCLRGNRLPAAGMSESDDVSSVSSLFPLDQVFIRLLIGDAFTIFHSCQLPITSLFRRIPFLHTSSLRRPMSASQTPTLPPSKPSSPAPVYRRTPLKIGCVQYDVKVGF